MQGLEATIRKITHKTKILVNEPMKNHTSFKIGGMADILLLPETVEDIRSICNLVKTQKIPFCLIGNGSNILVSDDGIEGIVMKTAAFDVGITLTADNEMEAGAGASLSQLSLAARENGLSGLEFAYGIPGSVGGAVFMNAGAYDGEIKKVLISSEYMDDDGNLLTLDNPGHAFGYRHSFFADKEYIILKSRFKLLPKNDNEIKQKMEQFTHLRKEKQPLAYPSAGSVFKRPEGMYAGKLIEECGLKGLKIGGAQVSDKHAGFIVNTGNATAKDVRSLISAIQNCVEEKCKVHLECEIKFVGRE